MDPVDPDSDPQHCFRLMDLERDPDPSSCHHEANDENRRIRIIYIIDIQDGNKRQFPTKVSLRFNFIRIT